MNISPWSIYLWGQLDSLIQFFTALAMICAFGVGAMIFHSVMQSDFEPESSKQWRSRAFKLLPVPIIFGLLATATPSSKTFAMMVVIPAIANSKPVQQDLPELYTYAIEALKAQLKDNKK